MVTNSLCETACFVPKGKQNGLGCLRICGRAATFRLGQWWKAVQTMIHIGILGAARIAPPAIIVPAQGRNDCKIVSVAARDPKRARAFAAEHGIDNAAQSYEDLIGDTGIDLIYNALPPHRHADLTIAALRAGKHVLCEKPFAMNADEAGRMVAASRETGLHLIEAFHYRFHPAFAEALAIVRSGELGPLKHIEAAFSVEIPYREGELRHTLGVGGGALMDLGCYPVHWLRTMMGEEPEIVSAKMSGDSPGVDLTTRAELQFPGGATGTVSCAMAKGTPLSILMRIEGRDGALDFINPLAPFRGYQISVTSKGQTRTLPETRGESTYHYQLSHTLDVLAGRAAPLTGGEDAMANMRIIDEIYTKAGWRPRGM
jgi:predicted dehydrogenase